ncbi:tripartite tricarboxylate transporter substrate binding protein [Piscinibacter sp. HJYY11]|uniref:Bug family tripartite tricarboxylate transporter substrate binding protein n=1 Tax=Piscinibacter sp. HJYY11 TaxID=2801333 RepID=UPI00191E77F6|nr:tripartite tricarboxylate transporter substrate-binding protein [Piscinibacter sp. HJYY11]MBL0727235.1 extra-cytoplasmic solute receptor [Piscinibacter sp. HJYY11]
MLKRRTCLQFAAAAALPALLRSGPALAQGDQRTARFIVGSAAGGPADVQARALAEAIRRADGSMMIVENRPGAAGRIAVQAMKQVPADGSHLLLGPGWVLTLAPQTDKSPSYDPATDLIPIGGYCQQEYALVVGPAAQGVKSIGQFVAWVKANPAKGQFGSAGVGSMGHLVASMFERSAGITLEGIPYKGAAPALQDVQAGHLVSYIGGLGEMIRMHRDGSARVLATSGDKRSKFLPDVPTFEESGFASVRAVDWTGIFAPAKTPAAVVARYARQLELASKDKEFNALLEKVGVEPTFISGKDLAARIKADSVVMQELVRSFKLKGST